MKKKLTIKDIARLAGTSTATVSRVINNKDYPVKKELRDKVLKVVNESNYSPNLIGKQLKTNTSNEIGVIIPNISNLYYNHLISGIEYALRDSNYQIILCNTNGDKELERKHLESMYQKQIKGLIISSVNNDSGYLEFLQKSGMKIVAFEQDIALKCAKVNFDYFEGGYLAAEYFIKKGHTKIGFISAPLTLYSRKKVFEGFMSCLEKYGLKSESIITKISTKMEKKNHGYFEYENGKNLALKIIAEKELPTALFCINDMTAFGAIHEFIKEGYRVPEDISIMGFDNIDIAEMITPSLTTIDQSTLKMGELAAGKLLSIFENDNEMNCTVELLKPKLIERKSTSKLN